MAAAVRHGIEHVVVDGVVFNDPLACATSMAESDSKKSNIDLYAVPHERMRDLVSWPLSEVATAADIQDLEPCLQAVYEAMWEMKTHEYIENNIIMNRLKARLQTKRVIMFSLLTQSVIVVLQLRPMAKGHILRTYTYLSCKDC